MIQLENYGLQSGGKMQIDPNVGRSDDRTPAKHGVLNSMLGREVSAAPFAAKKLGITLTNHILYDLTAGDGALGDKGDMPSPLIFAKHGLYRSQTPVRVEIFVLEKAPNTYATLLSNLRQGLQMRPKRARGLHYIQISDAEWQSSDGITTLRVVNDDASAVNFDNLTQGTFAFLNNDPNHVLDWALNCNALASPIARGCRLTCMTTMGCNVGGLKRGISREERDKWAATVWNMCAVVRSLGTMDNLLAEIESDAAQWAYLLTFPIKWIDEEKSKVAKIFSANNLRVKVYSAKFEPKAFSDCVDRLFTTHKERRNVA